MTVTVSYFYDEDSDPPWEQADGHGSVRKSSSPHAQWASDKRPGERPMNRADRHEYQFYYDWQAAMKTAEQEGWNAEPYGAPGSTLRAVESDFKFLSGWVNDEWHYCGVQVELLDDEGERMGYDQLWGVETYKDYHEQCAKEMAETLVEAHKERLKEQAHQERVANRYMDAQNLGIPETA